MRRFIVVILQKIANIVLPTCNKCKISILKYYLLLVRMEIALGRESLLMKRTL
jgi:hypothetical protein